MVFFVTAATSSDLSQLGQRKQIMGNPLTQPDPKDASRPSKRILAVEDDADFYTLVRMMLEGQPIEIKHVRDGESAINSICDFRPDLMILDLNLPDMSGWEVLSAVRDNKAECADIPIIILSSQGTRVDKHFGLQIARVHAYLTKPCMPSQFRSTVLAALGLS